VQGNNLKISADKVRSSVGVVEELAVVDKMRSSFVVVEEVTVVSVRVVKLLANEGKGTVVSSVKAGENEKKVVMMNPNL
jgi:hypothetical protein